MTRLYPMAVGLLAGAISSLIAFESVSILFFALGRYSQVQLTLGAVHGIFAGAFFGPLFALLRTSMGRAAAWEAGILAVGYLCAAMHQIAWGTGSDAVGDIVWAVQGVVYYALCGLLAGPAAVWTVRESMRWLPPETLRPTPASSPRDREGRYIL